MERGLPIKKAPKRKCKANLLGIYLRYAGQDDYCLNLFFFSFANFMAATTETFFSLLSASISDIVLYLYKSDYRPNVRTIWNMVGACCSPTIKNLITEPPIISSIKRRQQKIAWSGWPLIIYLLQHHRKTTSRKKAVKVLSRIAELSMRINSKRTGPLNVYLVECLLICISKSVRSMQWSMRR